MNKYQIDEVENGWLVEDLRLKRRHIFSSIAEIAAWMGVKHGDEKMEANKLRELLSTGVHPLMSRP